MKVVASIARTVAGQDANNYILKDMKRNKHTNVVVTPPKKEVGNTMIMKDSEGKLVQAEGIKLNGNFAKLTAEIMKAKGSTADKKESEEEIKKRLMNMGTVWSPDMIGKDDVTEEKPKKTKKSKKQYLDVIFTPDKKLGLDVIFESEIELVA